MNFHLKSRWDLVGKREKSSDKRSSQSKCPRPRTCAEHVVSARLPHCEAPLTVASPCVLLTGEGPGFLQPPVEPGPVRRQRATLDSETDWVTCRRLSWWKVAALLAQMLLRVPLMTGLVVTVQELDPPGTG